MKGERSTTIPSNSLGAPSQSLSSTLVFNIGDLPETLVPEILCRLPSKDAFRCKCVCKFWLTIISHPYYRRRALYLQQDNNCSDDDEPKLPMLVRYSYRNAKNRAELFTINSNRSLSLQEFGAMDISLMNKELVVVTTYNDLILLCETLGFNNAKYYICNPYTKEWVTIPPTCSYLDPIIGVGFICDSNYSYWIVQLLLLQSEPSFKLTVKIFSSETGIWIEAVVPCPHRFEHALSPFEHVLSPAVAYDGKLYWLGNRGFLIGLEPFNFNNNPNDNCQFISEPNADVDGHNSTRCVGVYKGCVRLCRFYYGNNPGCSLSVWELKEKEDGYDRKVGGVGGRKMKWNFKESVVLDSIDLSSYNCWALALDPNDENILYLQRQRREETSGRIELVACNIRTKSLIKITPRVPPSQYWVKMKAFPIMRPCWKWPTPVSKLPASQCLRKNRSSLPI